MPSTVKLLTEKGLILPPRWLPDSVHYETMMGSVAYGVSTDYSDVDIYGFCIPKKEMLFPHLAGEIEGFGRNKQRFEQWEQHHVADKDSAKQYDFTIFGIAKYFMLVMENNPNCIDSLFTPDFCVLHMTAVGRMMRDNRRMFLHKGCWHKFKGYAYSQLHKMSAKDPKAGSKRLALREKFGFDVKFAYNVVRLLDECEQILTLGDLDLQRDRERLKAIRRGEMTEEQIRQFFTDRAPHLEKLYEESKLPHSPDEGKIKELLLNCLEHHYGSLDKLGYVNPGAETLALRQIAEIIDKNRAWIESK